VITASGGAACRRSHLNLPAAMHLQQQMPERAASEPDDDDQNDDNGDDDYQ
jgi:hypothetical protein